VVVSVVVVVVCIKLGYTELIFCAEKRGRGFLLLRASFRENWKTSEAYEEISFRGNFLSQTFLSLLPQHQPKDVKEEEEVVDRERRGSLQLRVLYRGANELVLTTRIILTRFSSEEICTHASEKIKYICQTEREEQRPQINKHFSSCSSLAYARSFLSSPYPTAFFEKKKIMCLGCSI